MLLDIRPDHLQIVQAILQKHIPEYEVWAFGSRAKWKAKEHSDLDLCVITKEPLSFTILGLIAEDFSESDLPWKVDVVDWSTTNEAFQKIIEKDKVVIQKGVKRSRVMSSDIFLPLKSIVSILGGKRLPAGKALQTEPNSHPYIRVRDIGHRELPKDGLEYVPDKIFTSISRYIVETNDVILSIVGTVGALSVVDKNHHLASLTENCVKLNGLDRQDALYLYYYLISNVGQYEIAKGTVGAVQPKLPIYNIEKIPVPWHSKELRHEISNVLGALDDRIALLRETNTTLEAIAQALFKSWFVDFDPVHAKQQGLEPESMDTATAALFPASFEESELGLVPSGWRVDPIGDVVEIVGGGTPNTKEAEYWEPGEFAWTTPKDLSGLQSPVLLKTERLLSAKGVSKVSSGLLPTGTLLLSSRAPIGYLAIAEIPLAINQGYIAILPSSQLPPLYMYFWLKLNMDVIKSRSNGSTFMEISKKVFRPIPALVPPVELLNNFLVVANPIFARLAENERQAQTLAALRDTLLPRLISGQLRLPDTEALIEKTV